MLTLGYIQVGIKEISAERIECHLARHCRRVVADGSGNPILKLVDAEIIIHHREDNPSEVDERNLQVRDLIDGDDAKAQSVDKM